MNDKSVATILNPKIVTATKRRLRNDLLTFAVRDLFAIWFNQEGLSVVADFY